MSNPSTTSSGFDTGGDAVIRRTRPRAAESGASRSNWARSAGRTSRARGPAPACSRAASTAHPTASRTSARSGSASTSSIPFLARKRRKCSRTRRARLTPPVRRTRRGERRGFTRTWALSAIASSRPARIRSRRSPLFARWVMSVFRMTGQRPESGAASGTASASAAASSTDNPNRSTSWRRKFPVPWAQRAFSRHDAPPSRASSTATPRLPMLTTVSGSSPYRKRSPRSIACFIGIRRSAICRERRPVVTAEETESQSHSWSSSTSRAPGSLPCATIAWRTSRSPSPSRAISATLIVSAPTSTPTNRSIPSSRFAGHRGEETVAPSVTRRPRAFPLRPPERDPSRPALPCPASPSVSTVETA